MRVPTSMHKNSNGTGVYDIDEIVIVDKLGITIKYDSNLKYFGVRLQ